MAENTTGSISGLPRRIFLSCCDHDVDIARRVFEALGTQGLDCFFYRDDRAIEIGANWKTKLEEELRSVAAVLVLASESAQDSPYVLWELSMAIKTGRRIVPLFLDSPDTVSGLLFDRLKGLQGVQFADRNLQTALSQVAAELSDLIPKQSARVQRLPVELTSLLGRASELAEAFHLMTESGPTEARRRLLIVVAGPGAGKTSFANQLARDLYQSSLANAYWIQIRQARSSFALAELVRSELGLQVNNWQRDEALLLREMAQEIFSKGPLILVLDNAEGLICADPSIPEAVASWVNRCPQLTCIITTRVNPEVNSDEAHTFWLAPLARPAIEEIGSLSEASLRAFPSVQLFIRSRRGRTRDLGRVEDLRLAAEICAELDGSPFLIRLAGESRLSVRDLAANTRSAILGHEKVSAMLDASFTMLDATAQRCLLQATCFPQGFSLDAAKAIFLCDESGPDAAVAIIQRLCDSSLLEPDERHFADDLPDRYFLYTPVREFAAVKWQKVQPEVKLEHECRFATFYLDQAEQLVEENNSSQSTHAFDQLSFERDNLLRVLRVAEASGEFGQAVRAVVVLVSYYCLRGPAAILLQPTEQLRTRLDGPTARDFAEWVPLIDNALAALRWEISDWNGAMEASKSAIAALAQVRTPAAKVQIMNAHVQILQERGFGPEASAWMERAAICAVPPVPAWLTIEVQIRLAEAWEWTPRWREGLAMFRRLCADIDRRGNLCQRLGIHNRLGLQLYRAGLCSESLQHIDSAQDINAKVKDAKREGGLKTNRGIALADLGRYEEALAEFVAAEPLHLSRGIRGWATVNTVARARAECMQGNPAIALERLKANEALILSFPYEMNHAWMYLWSGIALFQVSRIREAIRYLESAEEVSRQHGWTNGLRFMVLATYLAEAYTVAGNTEKARPLLREALAIIEDRQIVAEYETRYFKQRAEHARDLSLRIGVNLA